MRYFKSFGLIILVFISLITYAQNKYAVSINYTPVLNTPDFESVFGGKSGKKVKLDDQGLIREMEFVKNAGTKSEATQVNDYLIKAEHDVVKRLYLLDIKDIYL